MRKRLIFDGSMKITEAQSTRYFAPPVLNRLMTWGFALIQETVSSRMSKHVNTCQKMSLVEVVCDVSSIIVVFGPAPNLEVCGQHFGMEGPIATLSGMSHCHTIHLRS